jgi:hypothetical protein
MNTTYRLRVLRTRGMYTYGETAATQELALLVPGNLIRGRDRLAIERTDWVKNLDGVRQRTVVVAAESYAGEWKVGP